MNVHLLKDKKFSQEIYNEIFQNLNGFNNPLKFIRCTHDICLDNINSEPDQIEEAEFKQKEHDYYNISRSRIMSSLFSRNKLKFPVKRRISTPEEILKKCDEFRCKNDIGENEFVILLTEQANHLNWFSKIDLKKNAFIHTTDWGYYLGCNSSYPITYEIIASVFYMILFENEKEIYKYTHKKPKGCINDFCEKKKEIRLKMRTADICPQCQKLMMERNFPLSILQQIYQIMEFLRTKIVSLDKFIRSIGISKVQFKGHLKKMFLTDLDNTYIKFTPLEKTVYHLFINHPEGIETTKIPDLRAEIEQLYQTFYNGSNLVKFKNSITNLCDLINPSMQEKISSIKKKITDAVGSKLADYYIIQKDPIDNKYKIKIDRSLINFK